MKIRSTASHVLFYSVFMASSPHALSVHPHLVIALEASFTVMRPCQIKYTLSTSKRICISGKGMGGTSDISTILGKVYRKP